MKYTLLNIIISIPFLTNSCISGTDNNKLSQNYRFDTFKVDTSLSKQSIFRYMDHDYEPLSLMQVVDKDTIRRKATSAVAIVELKDSRDRIKTTDALKCKATLRKDTLWINIGFSTGFSGAGVSIKVAGNKFNALPYQFYDVITDREDPVITIEKQKLILDQAAYITGDSLYGHLYLRTIDTDTVRKYAQGYFRTIITKE